MTMRNTLPSIFIDVDSNIETIRIIFFLKNVFYFIDYNQAFDSVEFELDSKDKFFLSRSNGYLDLDYSVINKNPLLLAIVSKG